MKTKSIFAALLLMMVGMQVAWGQGFRVYQSDGTQLQFSLKTDSIVFDNGLSGDEVFGPFTPVNQCIAGTWYKSKYETVTFGEDGTTDYVAGATYEFMPYQGMVIIYNAGGAPINLLKVHKVSHEKMIVSSPDGSNLSVWTSTKPVQLVTVIALSETSITLLLDESKRLTANVLPSDADNKNVTWESSDETIAEVNSNGRVTANAYGICTITCSAADGSGVKAECSVRVKKPDTMVWVDLGLPSGTLWATCNVGASSPEEYGDYFAWGETKPKSTYDWSTYKYSNGSITTMTKYCPKSNYGYNGFTDDKTELDPEDDAATANWGSGWQMPSSSQLQELYNSNYTTSTWTTQNGINGRRITSKSNGKSIFLPAAGYRYDASIDRLGGSNQHWSRSLHLAYCSSAYMLFSDSNYIRTDYSNRYFGKSVRPVRVK